MELDDILSGEPEPAEPQAPPPTGEPDAPEPREGRQRDEHGRFAPQPQDGPLEQKAQARGKAR
jgi:hypothetical protein